MTQMAMKVRALVVHLVVSQISNGTTRPTKGCLITRVARNPMVMLRSEMKVASKTILKRQMSPAVTRLTVKPRAARCLLVRWPRVPSLRWILRTAKVHRTPTLGRPCPQFPHPRRRERTPNPAWHTHPYCHSWTQNCQRSSVRLNGTSMPTPQTSTLATGETRRSRKAARCGRPTA